MGSNFVPDPNMQQFQSGQPATSRIHNEMDELISNRPKKCLVYRNESHHHGNCPYR